MKTRKGFTLVRFLTVVVIFGFALVLVIPLLSMSAESDATPGYVTKVELGAEELEEMVSSWPTPTLWTLQKGMEYGSPVFAVSTDYYTLRVTGDAVKDYDRSNPDDSYALVKLAESLRKGLGLEDKISGAEVRITLSVHLEDD